MGTSSSNLQPDQKNKNFTYEQLATLKKFFKDISNRSQKDSLNKESFLRVFMLPGILGERLFEVFDKDHDGSVSFCEFVKGLSIIIHGTKKQKIKFLFEMYDINNNGKIPKENLSIMLYCTAYGGHHYIEENACKNSDMSFSDIDHIEYKNYVESLVKQAFQKASKKELTFKEFSLFIDKNHHLLHILEDAFIFEKFNDEEDILKTKKRKKASEISERENLRVIIDNHCFKNNCCLSDIITPRSVKMRHRNANQKKDQSIKSATLIRRSSENGKEQPKLILKQRALSEQMVTRPVEMGDEITRKLCHAFEHMHHFHKGASLSSLVYKQIPHLGFLVSRYLVLYERFLYVFRKKDGLEPLRTVWLEGCAVRKVFNNGKKRQWGFEVFWPSDPVKKSALRFFTASEVEQNKWIEALQGACKREKFDSLYKLEKKIGSGHHSKIFSCTKIGSNRRYAAKIVEKKGMTFQEIESLRLELSILKLLHHPNIMHVRDVYKERNSVYIVTQLFEGGDLFDRIKKKGKYTEKEAKEVMWRLFDGVAHIHSMGVVHRDLKPENIMLRRMRDDVTVSIGDFGLAGFFAKNSVITVPCGTFYYAAPEVIDERKYGKKVDEWSLGVIMYVLLSGYLPYGSVTNKKKLLALQKRGPNLSSGMWQGVSEDAKDLIRSLMRYNPRVRMKAKDAMSHSWFKSME